MGFTVRIDGEEVSVDAGMTILEAADAAGVYIPRLCHHPSLGSSHGLMPVDVVHRDDGEVRDDGSGTEGGFTGCRLCLVEVDGRDGPVTACDAPVEPGMSVATDSDALRAERRKNLASILRSHPHACLQCAQREGCSRTQCSTNVPEDERCCPLLGRCELQTVALHVGIPEDLTKYRFAGLPRHLDEPLFARDSNLCISCLRCVRACRDLRGVETLGFVYRDGKAVVGPTRSANFADANCRFCGACAEVCPTGAIVDKGLPMGDRDDALLPCVANCPAGVNVPRYLDLIAKGDHARALAVIRERIPFPGILGRICFHPCEDDCRRADLNSPMGICGLKWFAADNGRALPPLSPGPSTGKRVAVIGAGPAGLSAAYHLALAGHRVTVFEAEDKPGGMLRYAIPDYRLPPEVLDAELSILDGLDIELRTGTRVGRDIRLDAIVDGHDAVFMGTGACLSRRIPVPGADLDGVLWGLDFLRSVKAGAVSSMEGSVFVIGGGNVAMDVARSAVRLGASSVRLACLESRDEMPAHEWEIEEAAGEGVEMHPSWGPRAITGDRSISGIELVRCTSVFNRDGRFAPTFCDSETRSFDCDHVVLAIGQASDLECLEGTEVRVERGAIACDGFATGVPGVFAGGEVSRGPASVVEAIADGAAAAAAIDVPHGGTGDVFSRLAVPGEPDPFVGRVEGFAAMGRTALPKRPAEERRADFRPVESCYSAEQAVAEAGRCLRCDLRLLIEPVTLPPDRWLELNEENVSSVPAIEGVVQLLDADRRIIVIRGTQDMRTELASKLGTATKARFFGIDPDPMYSKRESELMQRYLQQFGRMPEGDGAGDDLDDLF